MIIFCLFSLSFFIEEVFAIGRGRLPESQRETERQNEKSPLPPQGELPCRSPFSSILPSGSWARTHTRLV